MVRPDRTIIVWEIEGHQGDDYGRAKRALRGHSHFVQDVVLSSDGQFCLSGCVAWAALGVRHWLTVRANGCCAWVGWVVAGRDPRCDALPPRRRVSAVARAHASPLWTFACCAIAAPAVMDGTVAVAHSPVDSVVCQDGGAACRVFVAAAVAHWHGLSGHAPCSSR